MMVSTVVIGMFLRAVELVTETSLVKASITSCFLTDPSAATTSACSISDFMTSNGLLT